MSNCFLVQTEKSTNLHAKSYYTIAFFDKNFDINKIELTKVLTNLGVKVAKIRTSNTYRKTKFRSARNSRSRNKITQFRPKKYFVKTIDNNVIDDSVINKINDHFKQSKSK